MFVCTCMCMLCLWVCYYFMPSLHLFPSQLQLTMQLPSLLKSPLHSLPVCFMVSSFFPMLYVCDQSLAMYHQFRRFIQIPGRVYFEHYDRASYLTSSSFIRFLSPITSLGLSTIKHVNYYYLMPSLYLFPSQLQLTMRLPLPHY